MRQFLEDAESNTRAAQVNQECESMLELSERIDGCFESLSRVGQPMRRLPLFSAFAGRSQNAIRAALRVLTGGQVVETYPLLRLSIENALYAFYSADEGNALVWSRRGETKQDTKKLRSRFAIQDIIRCLARTDSKLANKVEALYDVCIERGAHPNVLGHLLTTAFSDSGVEVEALGPMTVHWCVTWQLLARAGVVSLLVLRVVPCGTFDNKTSDELDQLDRLTGSWKEFREDRQP